MRASDVKYSGPRGIVGQVVVTDIDIKFWSLVKLLVKLALAVIPAAIIFFVFVTVVALVIVEFFGPIPGVG